MSASVRDYASPPEWGQEAECAQSDPELWFPINGGSPRAALNICRSCAVRVACFEDAFADPERYGVWGGTTAEERRKMRRAVKVA